MNYQYYGAPQGNRTPSPQPPYPDDPPSPHYPPQQPVYHTEPDPNLLNVNYRNLPYPIDTHPSPPVTPEYRATPTYWSPTYAPTSPAPPPTPPQQFHYYDHAVSPQYQYQYSQCNGRRKALLIGINYIGTPNALKGCINDVRNIRTFLNERYGFRLEDMVVLTDDQQNPVSRPTRANIIRACKWLVEGARPNDSLFLHFSGHGGQTEDLDGDEEDGLDETIYPVDFKQTGMIVDDELHDILVKPLPAGCRLTAIFDCCHSGSVLDLPYEYSVDGKLKESNLVKETAKGLLSAGVQYARGDVDGIVATASTLFNRLTHGKAAKQKSLRTKSSPADVIQFSGCKDYQKSADVVGAGGEATGAMSWAFREVLTKQPNQSYNSLLANVRDLLSAKYSQKPVLSASHPIDTKLKFVL